MKDSAAEIVGVFCYITALMCLLATFACWFFAAQYDPSLLTRHLVIDGLLCLLEAGTFTTIGSYLNA